MVEEALIKLKAKSWKLDLKLSMMKRFLSFHSMEAATERPRLI